MYLYWLGYIIIHNVFIIKPKNHILLFIYLFASLTTASAQDLIYKIDKSKGLPTNHVYCTHVDKYGYLWLGTDNGIIRYNGYELKRFGYADGLSSIDVWDFYEDDLGRIFPLCITPQYGYLKNSKYYPITAKESGTGNKNISPQLLFNKNDTIWFLDRMNNPTEGTIGGLSFIYKDTIYETQKGLIGQVALVLGMGVVSINRDSVDDAVLYKFINSGTFSEQVICKSFDGTAIFADNDRERVKVNSPNRLYSYARYDSSILYADLTTCETGKFYIPVNPNSSNKSLKIAWVNPVDKDLHIFSYDSIYVVNPDLNFEKKISVNILSGGEIKTCQMGNYLLYDSLWGLGLCTPNKGLLLNLSGQTTPFERTKTDLNNARYIGSHNDTTSVWWISGKNTLVTLTPGGVVKRSKITHTNEITAASSYTHDKILLKGILTPYIYNPQTGSAFSLVFPSTAQFSSNLINFLDANPKKSIANLFIKEVVVVDTNNLYISSTILENGLIHFNKSKDGKVSINSLVKQRFNHIKYDKHNDNIYGYKEDLIFFYHIPNGAYTTVSTQTLNALGIKHINNVLTDDQGNIIIQDYSKIMIFNPYNNTIKKLNTSYNLEGAKTAIYKNRLVIAGNFGVAEYTINTSSSLTLKNLFINAKETLYKEVINVHVSNQEILLSTDNDVYKIDLTKNYKTLSTNKMLLAYYKDSIYSTGDTITIDKKNNTINLDLINPSGAGNLQFSYKLPSTKEWIQSNTIQLSGLPTGISNIAIIAKDDVWQDNTKVLTVFITPYWWQTSTGKLIILMTLLGIVVIIVLTASYFTKKIVSKNNERKNQQRDLELKSIYSQINPHFIFNTLGTAQYFIKKNKTKEAYAHISQFSDLLRAYLKSSREKYIHITEEIDNLKNYLEIQLSRFEQKFNYHITLDPSINPDETMIPSLLLQPIVENALNHGIFHMQGVGELNIKFLKDKDHALICIVDDNGIGRQKSKQIRGSITRKASSYGTILIKELIDAFNKYEPINIDIKYVDKEEPLTGTCVTIYIKTKNSK